MFGLGKSGSNGSSEPATVTEAAVVNALRTVQDPELHKDLVTLNMVRKVDIKGGAVALNIELTTPACPLKGQIESDVRQALGAVPGVEDVQIAWSAQVRSGNRGRTQQLPGVANVIAVASGKGGVGKSTVSVNLAMALAESGARVGILDADVTGPSIPILMGCHEQPTVANQQLIPPVRYGVRLMSIGFLTNDKNMPVVWRGPMVSKLIDQFVADVDWGELDYLVMDLPPGTSDATLTAAQSIPTTGVVIVTTPQDVALSDATKSLEAFRKLNVPILGLIENMSFFACPHCGERTNVFRHAGGERAAEKLGVPFLGRIPLAAEICELGDEGQPIVMARPASPQAEAFRTIARTTAGRVSVANYVASKTIPLLTR